MRSCRRRKASPRPPGVTPCAAPRFVVLLGAEEELDVAALATHARLPAQPHASVAALFQHARARLAAGVLRARLATQTGALVVSALDWARLLQHAFKSGENFCQRFPVPNRCNGLLYTLTACNETHINCTCTLPKAYLKKGGNAELFAEHQMKSTVNLHLAITPSKSKNNTYLTRMNEK